MLKITWKNKIWTLGAIWPGCLCKRLEGQIWPGSWGKQLEGQTNLNQRSFVGFKKCPTYQTAFTLYLDGQNKYNTGHHQNTVRWQDQNNYSDTETRHQINSQSLDRRSKLWVKKGLGLPGSTWWPIFNQSMWYHLVVKFASNAGSATWWPPSNQCRFPSSLSNPRATWWPHLQPIQIS